jgi:hypothetical protein
MTRPYKERDAESGMQKTTLTQATYRSLALAVLRSLLPSVSPFLRLSVLIRSVSRFVSVSITIAMPNGGRVNSSIP